MDTKYRKGGNWPTAEKRPGWEGATACCLEFLDSNCGLRAAGDKKLVAVGDTNRAGLMLRHRIVDINKSSENDVALSMEICERMRPRMQAPDKVVNGDRRAGPVDTSVLAREAGCLSRQ